MRKFVLSIFAVLMLCFQVLAQNQRVSGTVVHQDGSPVMMATISVKGTTTGTNTGLDGKYSINAPADAILVFSYLGLETQEIPVNGRTQIDVTMTPATEQIEQVVVIGYGTGQKLGTVTGAVAKVNSDIVNNKPVANVTDALQGQVSGLSVMTSSGEPTAGSSIRLHGVGSMDAGNSPLVVIDGVPSDPSSLLALNGDDFASVTVLKDASSTSIYGSRAANGVIFITTKGGKRNMDAIVKLNVNYGISQPTTTSYNMMGGKELLEWQHEFGAINDALYNTYLPLVNAGQNTNWFDYMFKRDVPVFGANLSVQGGTDRTSYYISGGYLNQDGITAGSSYKRYNVRTNLDVQANDWLKMGTNLSLSYDKRQTATAAGDESGQVYLNNPSMASITIPTYFTPYVDGKRANRIGGEYWDPWYEADMNNFYNENAQVNGSIYLQINPIKGLTIRTLEGLDGRDYTMTRRVSPLHLATDGKGAASRAFRRYYLLTTTNTIEYKFDVNRDHNITILAGQEGLYSFEEGFQGSSSGQTDPRMMLVSNGTEATMTNVGENRYEYNMLSFFGRVNYNYKEKYAFDVTVRNDASSKFGKDHRNAFFYSVGGLWNLSRENFLANNRVLTDLTLRVTYGTSGNSDIGYYESVGLIGTTSYQDQSGWGLSAPGNPNLGWESQAQLNAGFELTLWDRLTIGASYYHRKTSDMLMSIPYSMTSGFSSGRENTASMLNQGFDLDLNATLFQNKDWYVGFKTSMNYNKNKILSIFNGLDEYALPNYGLIYKVGTAWGAYYTQEFMGVDPRDGAPMWNDGNGNPTKDPNKAAYMILDKNQFAPFYGGFGINASWKGLSLTADFSFVLNKYIVNNDLYFVESSSVAPTLGKTQRMQNIWRKPGDITNIPKYGSPKLYDTSMMEDASFLRLKNLTVSYDFPKTLIRKSGFIQGLRIYAIGRNLLTFTKYTGYDPEIDANLTVGQYPNTRQYSFGIEITF